ncbi:MAG: hypothetical protein NVSMB27_50090 [Ktedonobacteraceae bacterium]
MEFGVHLPTMAFEEHSFSQIWCVLLRQQNAWASRPGVPTTI